MFERLALYPSEIQPRRPYRNFFEWSANLPLKQETIDKSFAMTESARVVDLVGCANITNLVSIAESFSNLTEGEVRIFDAARETNMLLPFYFQQIGVKEVFSKNGVGWYITKIPLIADCDNGYGDLAILNRVVNEYESAGITGICIEDNIFPKRCSFYNKGSTKKLISIEEHAAKIKLATHVRRDKNFFVIARTESFIAGFEMREALKRANAYAQAGADAICIHSKKSDASEMLAFARLWKKPTPLVAIPTTYYTVSPSDLYKAGYKVVIFANQLLRNSIQSMQTFLKHMQDEGKRLEVFSQKIVSLEEVFTMTNVYDIKKMEKEFFS